MITESIKTLLGEELTKQVEMALSGKGKDGKDVDLVVGNDGSFVPADKYEGEKRRATSAESALKSAADAVKSLGGSGDPSKLGDDVTAVKGTLDTLKGEHKKEIAKIQKDTALRMALSGLVHDPSDVMGLLDTAKIEVGEDGSLKTDLTEFIKPIQERKPYLFKEHKKKPEQQPLKGAQPAQPSGGNSLSKKEPKDMNYTELCSYMEAHPEAKI